jgi:Flp pilus assembly pilin Flp
MCPVALSLKDPAQVINHFYSEEVPMLRKLLREESGQDMIEYALLASFISIVAIATLRLIGPLIVIIYEEIQTALA